MKKIYGLSVAYVLFIIWMIYLADMGGGNAIFHVIKGIPYGDKVGHFFLMGCLALVINLSLQYRMSKLWKLNIPVGSIWVLSFVVLEEITQMGNTHRTFDLLDLTADFFGIAFFTWVGFCLKARMIGGEKTTA